MNKQLGEETTLSYAQETALRADLRKGLQTLQDSHPSTLRLEYGDPTKNPGSYLSYIRIRYMVTFGILQFRICELSNGIEGSGSYHPDLESALEWAMRMIRHYHRPNPIRDKLKAIAKHAPPDLAWFTFDFTNPVVSSVKTITDRARIAAIMENAVTITLPGSLQ